MFIIIKKLCRLVVSRKCF